MKKLFKNKQFINKAICLVLSFTLAFSFAGTPAFAATTGDATPADTQVDAEAQNDAIQEKSDVVDDAVDAQEDASSNQATEGTPEGTPEEDSGSSAGQQPADEEIDPTLDPKDVKDIVQGVSYEVTIKGLTLSEDKTYASVLIGVENFGTQRLDNIQLTAQLDNPYGEDSNFAYSLNTSSLVLSAATPYKVQPGKGWTYQGSAVLTIQLPYSEEVKTADLTLDVSAAGQTVTKTQTLVLDQQRTPSYELTSSFSIYNDQGVNNAVNYVRPVSVGDVIHYSYTIKNTGYSILHDVSARTDLALNSTYRDDLGNDASSWPAQQDIAIGEELTYTGTYTVTEADAAAGRTIRGDAFFFINGREVSTSPAPLKAVQSVDYSVFYYIDFGDGELYFADACKEMLKAPVGTFVDVKPGTGLGQLNYLSSAAAAEGIYYARLDAGIPDDFSFEGFEANSTGITIESTDVADNVIEVVYSLKVNFKYTINYYRDSISLANKLNADAVTGKALIDSEFTVPEDQLNTYLPEGYTALTAEDAPSIVINKDEASNTIDIVYTQKNDYKYSINYYLGEVNPNYLLNDLSNPAAYEGIAQYGQQVALTNEQLNAHLPRGYAALDQTSVAPLTIGVDESSNVINVVYANKANYTYTINYFYGEGATTPAYSDQASAPYGSTITISDELANAHLSTGYVAATGTSFVVSDTAQANTVNIVYARQADIPYVINFYKDSALARNKITSIEGTASFIDVIDLSPAQMNQYLPAVGYKAKSTNQSFTIGATAQDNVFDVVFERDSFSYTIEYYKKEIIQNRDVTTYIGSYTPSEKIAYGSTVTVDAKTQNRYYPGTGFIAKTPTDQLSLTIGADPAKNVVRVEYDVKSYHFEVNYYQDSISPENKLHTIEGESRYGAIQMYHSSVINAYKPDGYAEINGTKYLSITDDPAKNVLNIVYAERQTGLPYQVKYYLDSIDDKNLIGSVNGMGDFGENIPYALYQGLPEGYNPLPSSITGSSTVDVSLENSTMYVVYSKASYDYVINYYQDQISDETFLGASTGRGAHGTKIEYTPGLYLPEGYDASIVDVSGSSMISTDSTKNVLNVVYTHTASIAYQVNYYAGSVGGELLGQINGTGAFGSAIPYDPNYGFPQGFTGPAQLYGSTIISLEESVNVLNVVFPPAQYGYTVNYYKDEIAPENLQGTDTGVANFRDVIPFKQGKYAPRGYQTKGLLDGSTTVSFNPVQNVLNVVYKPGYFSYTINYYLGNVLKTSVQQPAHLFGTTVDISAAELNYYLEEGYERLTEGTSVTITENPANNVVNVVFTPDFTSFYNSNIGALNATYNGSKHFLGAPKGLVPGDIITYSYNGMTQTRVYSMDVNVAAVFEDVTDGEVPVTITLTRANVVSDAIVSTVNIAPAPEENAPVAPIAPIGPTQVVGDGMSSIDMTPADFVSSVISAATDVIAPAVEDVLAPSYTTVIGGVAVDKVTDIIEDTITDDANPLANLIGQSRNITMQQSPFEILDTLLVVMGALCLAVSLLLVIMRKRILDCTIVLKGDSLAVARSRARVLGHSSILTTFFSVCFFLLWLLFRL